MVEIVAKIYEGELIILFPHIFLSNTVIELLKN